MGRKILIIDDEPDIVTYLRMLLEDQGYTVISATDAQAGMEMARKQKPDLICLDIMMPKRSGLSLYKDFKMDEELRTIEIIIVSALAGAAYGFKGAKFRKLVPDKSIPEPAAIFEKPVNVGKFIDYINSLLGEEKST